MWLFRFLNARSRGFVLVFGLGLIALVGLLDYGTGPELSFSIFYVIPIALLTWYAGREMGIVASTASAFIWLLNNNWRGQVYDNPTIPYWNAVVRYGFFLIVTLALTSLHHARDEQEEMGSFIVHDLRAPLGNVFTGLSLLQEMTAASADGDTRDLITTCLASCDRMLNLINSLLDLNRMESRVMQFQTVEVSSRALLDDAVRQVAALYEQSQVQLETHVDEGAAAVLADRDICLRILINLLGNAVKYSPRGSTVTASATLSENGMIVFAVADQGQGIPKEWHKKVFEKFGQVEARRAGVATGSGLGLAFCKIAVEQQGGRIWLDSAPGQGTTVTFTLPAASTPPDHPA